MIRCQNCGKDNYDGAQYCEECGSKLFSAEKNNEAAPDFQIPYPETPVFRGANVTSVGIPPIVEELKNNPPSLVVTEPGDGLKSVHATVTIERGNLVGKEFSLTGKESYLGRWDADNGVFPDVDLDAHDPEAKVSRRHARIIRQNGQYQIEDLGSTNGTYVNRGRRLIPGTPQPLADGDEIIVGKTFLRFKIS